MLYFRNPFTRLDFRPAAGTFRRFADCQAEEEVPMSDTPELPPEVTPPTPAPPPDIPTPAPIPDIPPPATPSPGPDTPDPVSPIPAPDIPPPSILPSGPSPTKY